MKFKFRHKILLAGCGILFLAFTGFALYNDYLQRQSIRSNLEVSLDQAGELTAASVENWLNGRLLLLQNLADNAANHDYPEAQHELINQPAFTSNFLFTYLGGADGSFIQTPDEALPEDYDPRTRPWYSGAAQAHGAFLTKPYQDTTGILVVTMSAPIRQGAQLLGVAGGDLSLETLVSTINSLDFNGLGHAFLVSGDGQILVSPHQDQLMKNLREIYSGEQIRLEQRLQAVRLDGQPRLLTFAPITGLPTDWYIGLSIDQDKAMAPLAQFRTSALIAMLLSMAAIAVLLNLLISVLMRPLQNMGRAMADIAEGEGDLTRRLAIDSQDEFGEVSASFNQFVERIHASISEVASATRQVHDLAVRVMTASNASITGSNEQSARTESVAAAINELGAAAQEIARNAADASSQASNANEQAAEGRQVMEQTIAAMSELSTSIDVSRQQIESVNASTEDISKILEVIKGISEQTNLLALNAAIEAARAGDAGRGFAVVADEVRNLAHRTQESAEEIHRMISTLQQGAREAVGNMHESQKSSADSVTVANQAGERLDTVVQRIGEIDGMNQSVAAATEEQTTVVEALNMDIHQINVLNQQGMANLNETLRDCDALSHQASRLKQLVDSFRI